MTIYNEDDAQRLAGFGASVTGAVGSDASLDLTRDALVAAGADVDADTEPAQLELGKALEHEHPDYVVTAQKWRKYLDLYASNDIYRFIFRHLREVDVSWKARVERGYFYNYVKSVVDLFAAFLFHAPIDRDPGSQDEEFEIFYKDSDLSGTLWPMFMLEACTFALVEGHVGILVDAPRVPEGGFQSEEERKEADARPYVTLVHALQILDWEIDQFGNFIWVKLEVFRPMDRSWDETAEKIKRHFVVWTRERWDEYVLEQQGDTGDSIGKWVAGDEHDLGVVPLVIVRVDKDPTHVWFGQSAVTDIADINIGILNWSSLGDEEIYERCLNLLAMERGEGDAPIEITHHNVLEYEPGTNKPEYLQPGATPLSLIMQWIKEAREEIKRLAKLNISAGLGDVRQASSGIAKAFAFLETNQTLTAKAQGLEQVEIKVHRLLSRWMEEPFDGSIAYPREFGVEDFLTLFQEMDMARSSLTSETAIKESEKKLTRKLFARDTTKLRKKIEREIDSADTKMPSVKQAFGMIPPGFQKGDSEPGETEGDEDTGSESEESPPNRPEGEKATAAGKAG